MQSCKDACQPAGVRLHARGMCYTHKSNSDNAFFKNPTLPLRKIHHLLRLIGEEERWACWRPPLGRRRHGCRFRLSLGATRPDPVVAAPWRSADGFAFGYVPRAGPTARTAPCLPDGRHSASANSLMRLPRRRSTTANSWARLPQRRADRGSGAQPPFVPDA
jgi:hypothetical protein